MEQLGRGTKLFCFLDGVSWYEQEPWDREMHFLVGMFKDMVRQPVADGPLVKVLMTSANQSVDIQELVDVDSEYVCLATEGIDYTPITPKPDAFTCT